MNPISFDRLKEVAALAPEPNVIRPVLRGRNGSGFNLGNWIAAAVAKLGWNIDGPRPAKDGGLEWRFRDGCPFQEGYRDANAAIHRSRTGKIGFKCFCGDHKSKGWRELRELAEGPQPATQAGTQSIPVENVPDDGKWAEFSGPPQPPDLLNYLPNDHGNACRLIAMYGEDLRYCHPFKKWLVWDGTRWAVDETDRARWHSKQTMLEFLRQTIEKNIGEKAERFARSCLDARRITSMLSMAESEIYVRPGELDTDPYALNFLNGTVDLRTGALRPHERQDFITRLIHYEYRPDATCELWHAFLDEIMGGGPSASESELARAQRLTDFLQRALGYSLTGCTIEKAVFVLFGAGDNGKSTMLSTFRQLVEEYAVLLQVETLMVRQESNNTQADLADLRGARFVQTSETEQGQRLAQGKLKRITQGMGKIKAVRKYENPIEFPETHKLWMDTNKKPTIRDADDCATFNRLQPIPFMVKISKIDREMPAKLLQEAEGILAWAVVGAKLWYQSGLNKPPEVEAAREQWRSEMDQLGRFIEERCAVVENFRVRASVLYSEYQRWAEVSGEKDVMSLTAFGLKLPDRGFAKEVTKRGIVYLGIGLKPSEDKHGG